MKKILGSIFVFIFLAASILSLVGCNANIGFGSYTVHFVHVQMYGGECIHLKVNSWKNDDGGIELETESFGSILLGDGTYMMYDSRECPICGKVDVK